MEEKLCHEWELRGYSCAEWEVQPGQCWEDNKHEVDELFMLLEGEVELVIAGKTCKPQVNEVVHIPAKTKHSVRNIGSAIAKWLYGYANKNANEADIQARNN